MPEMSVLAGFIGHFILPFALFGIPLVLLGAVAGFLIWKDFEQAVDTTSAAERLSQALEQHRQQVEEAAQRRQLALEHAEDQHQHQLTEVRAATLRTLHAQMRSCAQAGMAADLQAACQAALQLDSEDALAQRYLTSLAQRPVTA